MEISAFSLALDEIIWYSPQKSKYPLSIALMMASTGADPGFLEKGFRCIKRVLFADFTSFFFNILMKMK